MGNFGIFSLAKGEMPPGKVTEGIIVGSWVQAVSAAT